MRKPLGAKHVQAENRPGRRRDLADKAFGKFGPSNWKTGDGRYGDRDVLHYLPFEEQWTRHEDQVGWFSETQ
jgi:hypothetical protein